MNVTLTAGTAGQRADQFLAAALDGLTRSAAQKLLEADPGLSRREHAPLLGRVRRLFAQHGDMFN